MQIPKGATLLQGEAVFLPLGTGRVLSTRPALQPALRRLKSRNVTAACKVLRDLVFSSFYSEQRDAFCARSGGNVRTRRKSQRASALKSDGRNQPVRSPSAGEVGQCVLATSQTRSINQPQRRDCSSREAISRRRIPFPQGYVGKPRFADTPQNTPRSRRSLAPLAGYMGPVGKLVIGKIHRAKSGFPNRALMTRWERAGLIYIHTLPPDPMGPGSSR